MNDTIKLQLDSWLEGTPIHNADRDECCPDFSCCTPQLLAEKSERERFYKAWEEKDEDTQMEMLMTFLERMIQENCPCVNLVGG